MIDSYKKNTFVSARLLKRKKDGLSANHTWEEVEVANSETSRVTVSNLLTDNDDDITTPMAYINLPKKCKGITITNNRCSRTVKSGNYCYQHMRT